MEKRSLKYINVSPNPDLNFGNIDKNGDSGNSGFDIYAWVKEDEVKVKPLERVLIHTGLYFEVPKDCEIQIRSRSGYSLKYGIVVANSPGTIDSNYTGEIGVIVHNLSNEDYIIKDGAKIAQGVLCPVYNGYQVNLTKVDKITENEERGSKAYASSGF